MKKLFLFSLSLILIFSFLFVGCTPAEDESSEREERSESVSSTESEESESRSSDTSEEEDCEHYYENDCTTECAHCGFSRKDAKHSYVYACDTECSVCGEWREGSEHAYKYECDLFCADCGEDRESTGHQYEKACATQCVYCGGVRETLAPHRYDNACDTSCNECGEERPFDKHHYDNACDAACNECGAVRTVGNHEYDNACDTNCNICDAPRTVGDHEYDNACDTACNICDAPREVGDHAYDNACDAACNHCGAPRTVGDHAYDNACDTNCNICDAPRTVGDHEYENACDTNCNICDAPRTVGDHEYDNACDVSCNICDAPRTVGDHEYDNACDADCNECGDVRTVGDHEYENACDTNCNICNAPRTVGDHEYDNDCDVDCNVCGATRKTEHDYDSVTWICRECGDHYYTPGLEFTYVTDHYVVSGYSKQHYLDKDVVIPALYKGEPVTEIAAEVFRSKEVCTIVIPSTITAIGKDAFLDPYTNGYKVTDVYITDLSAWCGIDFANACANPLYYGANLHLNGELVTELAIPADVIEIEAYAFDGFNGTSVSVPPSVTAIGENAFRAYYANSEQVTDVYITDLSAWCGINFANEYANPLWGSDLYLNGTLVTDLTLPEGVTAVSDYAFYRCSSIESVTVPVAMTTLGSYAFYACDAIKAVTVSGTVSEIGDYAFYDCRALVTATLSGSVNKIGKAAFANAKITSLTLSSALSEIGASAFSNALKFESLTIPDTVTAIGESAFFACGIKTLTAPSTLTDVGANAFEGTHIERAVVPIAVLNKMKIYYLTDLTINGGDATGKSYRFDNLQSVTVENLTAISESMFKNSHRLSYVTLGDTVTSIGREAFYNCQLLTTVTLGKAVNSIDILAFYNCERLVEVINHSQLTLEPGNSSAHGRVAENALVIHDGTSKLVDKERYRFLTVNGVNYLVDYVGSDVALQLPESYNDQSYEIYAYAFYRDPITSVSIPGTAKKIGMYAFAESELSDLTISDGVELIDHYAFSECIALVTVTVPGTVKKLGSRAFGDCSALTSVTLLEGVSEIGGAAFASTSLESLRIPNTLTSLGSYAFGDCEPICNEYGGGYYLGNETKPYLVLLSLVDKSCEAVTIHEDTLAIYSEAFCDCPSLKALTIPDKVRTLGTIRDCPSLEALTIGKSVELPYDLYNNCPSLSTVTFHCATAGGVLGETALKTVIFGNTVTSIGDFGGCTSLTDIHISSSVTEIRAWAFEGCTSLKTPEIPNSVTSIGSAAFVGCTSLTALELPISVTEVGEGAFAYCTALKSLTVPDSVTSMGLGIVRGCTSLESLTLPFVGGTKDATGDQSKNRLGYAFGVEYVQSHKNIVPASLTTVVLTNERAELPSRAFIECVNLVTVEIKGEVTSLGYKSFEGCTSLTTLTLPDTLTSINDTAFTGCEKLGTEYNGVYYLGSETNPYLVLLKSTNTSIQSFAVPEGIRIIYSNAFYDHNYLMSVTLSSTVVHISSGAFAACYHLAEVINLSSLSLEKGNETHGSVAKYALEIHSGPSSKVAKENDYVFYTAGSTHYLVMYLGTEKEIVLPAAYNSESYEIGAYAFIESDVTSVVIPNGVTKIGAHAFAYCKSLEKIELGEGVTEIGTYALQYSTVTSITIPTSVKTIGSRAFFGSSLSEAAFVTPYTWKAGTRTLDSEKLGDKTQAATWLVMDDYGYYEWKRT